MRHLPTGTVTLLFTDIEGSTRLLQRVGECYATILEAYRSLLRAAFLEFDGYEVDTQGDAFFVAFARASDAVTAAVAAQRALADHPWPQGATVRVRMGLHTGEPSQTAEGYVGLDLHRAARIMSAGHGGQVLLSYTTRDLVEQTLPQGVSLLDLGAHRLKDLQQKSQLYQLVIAGLPADFPPLKTLDSSPNNLPLQPTPFIGREKEVNAVQPLLLRDEVRLLTLTGPGGTGKTRLGLQVAAQLSDHFADGVFFVNLAPISDSTFVVPAIAGTLGLKETGEQPLHDLLQASLQDRQLLLLLDNFEQVLGAAEHVADLVALSQYEAVALFISRAQAVKPDFQVTNANALAVAEICAHLDGLPLAIELAAARVKLLPPQALLARLGKRLAVLTSRERDRPSRQQTLRNTIAWSYHLLDADEQRLFRRLSVFVGGCQLSAIEAMCSTLGDQVGPVLDTVASLIDKSLLQQTEQEGEEPRLLMLETIREYGLEVLAASGEMEITRQAHASYYLRLSEEAELELAGPRQAMWLERLEQEHENLRAVMQWSLEQAEGERGDARTREIALRLGGALRQFWYMRSYFSEGRDFLEQALARSDGVAASVRAKALFAATRLHVSLGYPDRAEALCEESLALYRELGDKESIAYSLQLGGLLALGEGETALAYPRVEQAVALFKEMRHRYGMTVSLYAFAQVVEASGDDARSQSLYEEGIAVSRKTGNRQFVAFGLKGLARVVAVQGELSWAARLWGAAETLRETIGAPIPPVERPAYEPSVTAASAQLGEKPFATAWAEGRLMTPEQALAAREPVMNDRENEDG